MVSSIKMTKCLCKYCGWPGSEQLGQYWFITIYRYIAVYIQGLYTVYNCAGVWSTVAVLGLAMNQGYGQPQQGYPPSTGLEKSEWGQRSILIGSFRWRRSCWLRACKFSLYGGMSEGYFHGQDAFCILENLLCRGSPLQCFGSPLQEISQRAQHLCAIGQKMAVKIH
jgi:hypothetical protein